VRQSLGSAVLLHVRAKTTHDSLLRVLVADDADVREGQTVGVSVRLERLHYFDAEDGRRVESRRS
jgi:hypothetical protein